jgi:CHRD domain
VPPVETAATGTAELTYDPATRVLTWTLNYSGLSGPTTMAHKMPVQASPWPPLASAGQRPR